MSATWSRICSSDAFITRTPPAEISAGGVLVISQDRHLTVVAEDVLAEVDEGLCGARDVAVALPCEPDVHVDRTGKRQCTDALYITHNHIEEEGVADAAFHKSHDGDDLIGLEHDIRRDACGFHLLQHGLPQEGAFLEHDEVLVLDVL